MKHEDNRPHTSQRLAHPVDHAPGTSYISVPGETPVAAGSSPASTRAHSIRAQMHWGLFVWLVAAMFMLHEFNLWGGAASLPEPDGAVTEVRTLYPSEWGIPRPVGLAYLSGYDHLVMLADTNASGPVSDTTSIVTITPYEDLMDAATLPFAVADAINLAYDGATRSLLVLERPSEIVQIAVGDDGIPVAGSLIRTGIEHLGLVRPEGMAVDERDRRLFILDSGALNGSNAAVVVADLDNGFAFVAKLDLADLNAVDLRGLSFHPHRRTLFVSSPSQARLFEIDDAGSRLSTYDLAPLVLMNQQGLTFGPSADLTDAPETVHLFLADKGENGTVPLLGRILEAALPPAQSPGDQTLRFAVIGDYGNGSSAQGRVAALVDSWNPDFIITTGDNNYPDGEASTIDEHIGKYFSRYIGNYQGAYGPGSPTNRFWPSLGNHDWHSITCVADQCSGPYFDYFTLPNNERYYTVDLGLVRLFALDSERDEPDGSRADSVQAAWLREQLAASTACYNVVFFHRPPYSSGRHGGSRTLQWPFAEWGAHAVITGHEHLYERLEVDGIPYFVNGASGAGLYEFENLGNLPPEATSVVRYNQAHGAMLVTASTTGITYQFYSTDGLLIDNYTVESDCAVAPATATPNVGDVVTAPVTANGDAPGSSYLYLPLLEQ